MGIFIKNDHEEPFAFLVGIRLAISASYLFHSSASISAFFSCYAVPISLWRQSMIYANPKTTLIGLAVGAFSGIHPSPWAYPGVLSFHLLAWLHQVPKFRLYTSWRI
jgi:hypothetical protein